MLSPIFYKKIQKKSFWTLSVLCILFVLSGCANQKNPLIGQTLNEGYILDKNILEAIPIGSSKEQVILSLGSPSATSLSGDNAFYYISQKKYRAFKFNKATIIDRRVLAIYFNKDGEIKKIAEYGLKDGKIFDFLSDTTPTLGKDKKIIGNFIYKL